MLRRINLFSGPGAGKSTTAAKIFGHLKTLGVNAELIHEYIKTWAYQDIKATSFDQLYIFAKQLRAEDILLRSGVKHIVSDSPITMQLAYVKMYGEADLYDELMSVAKKFDQKYPSLNIFLDRQNIPYQQDGRWQGPNEAKQVDTVILDILDNCGTGYTILDAANTDTILQTVEEAIGWERKQPNHTLTSVVAAVVNWATTLSCIGRENRSQGEASPPSAPTA